MLDLKPILAAPHSAHFRELITPDSEAASLSAEDHAIWLSLDGPSRRHAWLAGKVGVKNLLQRYQSGRDTIEILRHPRGKPYLANGPHFSISHTLDRVFIIISQNEVGLDIESARRRAPSPPVAETYFLPEEQAFLAHLPPAQAEIWRLRLWVAKEATVKLSGDGIAYGLRKSLVLMGDGLPSEALYDKRRVYLHWPDLGPEWHVVIASWVKLDVKCFVQNKNAP